MAGRQAREGMSLTEFESCLKQCHFPGPDEAASRAYYIRTFLRQRNVVLTGKEGDTLQIEAMARQYEAIVAAHEARTRERMELLALERAADDLEREVQRLEFEERLKRYPGTIEIRRYPVLVMHAAMGQAVLPLVEVAEIAVQFVPVVGQVVAGIEAITGHELLTGRELAPWQRGLNAVLAALPLAGGLVRGGAAAAGAVVRAAGRAGVAAGDAVKAIRVIAVRSASSTARLMEGIRVAQRGGKLIEAQQAELKAFAAELKTESAVASSTARAAGAESARAAAEATSSTGRTARATEAARAAETPATAAERAAEVPARAAAETTAAVAGRAAPAAARGLARFDAATQAWLRQRGFWTAAARRALKGVGDDIVSAISRFKGTSGFDTVLANYLAKGPAQEGARFVMRFALARLSNARAISFEMESMVSIMREAGSLAELRKASRFVDIFADGVRYEMKSVIEIRAALVTGAAGKFGQLQKDIIMALGSDLSRLGGVAWVFNSAKMSAAGLKRVDVVKRLGDLLESTSLFSGYPLMPQIRAALDKMIHFWP